MTFNPILTIAIPTWNREKILGICLDKILPQIYEYKDCIQFVISDNCSTDNTCDLIDSKLAKYKGLEYVFYKQTENTGYFGNFKKCRELSLGRFFWLLSDNDFVENGLIKYIVNLLVAKKPGFIFLNDWSSYNENRVSRVTFKSMDSDVNSFFRVFGDRSTLISSVIFPNEKKSDFELYANLKSNSFLGFFLFLASIKMEKEGCIVFGRSLNMYSTKVSFNVFRSFGEDLISGLNFLESNFELPRDIKNSIVNLCIENISSKHYIVFRVFGKVHNINPGNRTELEKFISEKFSEYSSFDSHYKPLFRKTKFEMYFLFFGRKVIPFILKKIKSFNASIQN